jgi:hypothetical protein
MEDEVTGSRPPKGFPERFGSDVTVRDIDLDAEEFIVGGERLTVARAVELAERAERRAGRPSLTAPGAHSPALNLRVSVDTKARLEAVAEAEGRRQSDVVREALEEYLTRHGHAS